MTSCHQCKSVTKASWHGMDERLIAQRFPGCARQGRRQAITECDRAEFAPPIHGRAMPAIDLAHSARAAPTGASSPESAGVSLRPDGYRSEGDAL